MKSFGRLPVIYATLGPFKVHAVALLLILFSAALTEALSIGMIIPFMGTLLGEKAGSLDTSRPVAFLDEVLSHVFPAQHRLVGVCGVVLSLFLLKNLLLVAKVGFSVYFTNSLRQFWTCRILNKYMSANYNDIISEKKGVLLNNLISEPLYASKSLKFLISYVAQILVSLSLFATMLLVNWKVTSVATLSVAVLFALLFKVSRRYSLSVGRKRIQLNQSIHSQAEEILNGIRQVKIYSLEKKIFGIFRGDFHRLMSLINRFNIINGLPLPLGETAVIAGLVATLIYVEYFSPVSTVGLLPTAAFFLVVLIRLFNAFSYLFSGRMSLLSFFPSLRLVHSLCEDKHREFGPVTSGRAIRQLKGDVVFDSVSFSYPDSDPILRDVNLNIRKGTITAIVGQSGAGKSTILDLLNGFYQNYSGQIFVDGNELRSINLLSWRKLLGFVSQDAFIFNTSVWENILLGSPDATKEQVVAAAQKAGAYSFIQNLPGGFDTILGDRGMAISGGERQRIAIARALVREPDFLIFDEATSSLDSESERAILKAIEKMRGDKTILMITHRFSTIKNADVVYALEDGRIEELGTYREFADKRKVQQALESEIQKE